MRDLKTKLRLMRIAVVAAAFVAFTSLAGAQTAYINFTAQHIDSSAKNITQTAGSLDSGLWLFGPQFGIQTDFMRTGPLHMGVDFRGSILSRGDAKFNNGMGGVRASLHTRALPITPFVQASAGIAGFNYGRRQAMTTILQYELDGGVDVSLAPRVSWKLVEVGGGGLSTLGSGASGANGTFHISTGIGLRF